jgi:hypothetical protein
MVPSGDHVQCRHRRQHAQSIELSNGPRSSVEVFPGSKQYSKKRNVIFTTAGGLVHLYAFASGQHTRSR